MSNNSKKTIQNELREAFFSKEAQKTESDYSKYLKDTLQTYLKLGADIDYQYDDDNGNTLLHIATKRFLPYHVLLLYKRGADDEIKNKSGHTIADFLRLQEEALENNSSNSNNNLNNLSNNNENHPFANKKEKKGGKRRKTRKLRGGNGARATREGNPNVLVDIYLLLDRAPTRESLIHAANEIEELTEPSNHVRDFQNMVNGIRAAVASPRFNANYTVGHAKEFMALRLLSNEDKAFIRSKGVDVDEGNMWVAGRRKGRKA